MSGYLLLFVLILTSGCFVALWFEEAWAEFFHWGPPMNVGSVKINNWRQWSLFVSVLVLFQTVHVYMEEQYGRPFDRQHIQQKKWTKQDIIWLSIYNFYKWLCTILYILIAVTRLDIWLVIAIVDTSVRAYVWSPELNGENGRRPRVLTHGPF